MIRQRLAVSALLVATLVTWLGGVASAKGPETATLEGPGIDQPIVFLDQGHTLDGDHVPAPMELMALTGLWQAPLRSNTTLPVDLGPEFTVTWVNMGPPGKPVEERTIVQYLYPDTAAGPFVHTPSQIGVSGWGAAVVGSFEAPGGLAEAIYAVIAWSETPAGVAMQPEPAPAGTPAPALWLILVAVVGFIGAAIFRSGRLA